MISVSCAFISPLDILKKRSLVYIVVDHFNNGQPVNRHVLLFPQQQQQQIVQHPPLMYATPVHNFVQPYPGNLPIQQQQQQQPLMFIPSGPRPQQSWILPSPPPPPPSVTSIPTFIPTPPTTFHPIQPPLPPLQPSFSGGTGIPQPSFSGGTAFSQQSYSSGINTPQTSFSGNVNVSQPSLGSGTGIPQPPFSGGTAVLKRKSHFLEESDYDPSVSSSIIVFSSIEYRYIKVNYITSFHFSLILIMII